MGRNTTRRSSNYIPLKRLQATVLLLCFLVVLVGGFMSGVSLTTLCVRSVVVWAVIAVITRIVVQILVTNEEMNGGQG